MARPRLHFHTDCAFFAGCENMLAVLFADPGLREKWDLLFSYRKSPEYEAGLKARIPNPPPTTPLRLPDVDALSAAIPWPLNKIFSVGCRALFVHQIFALVSAGVLWKLFRRINPAVLHINQGGWPGAGSSRGAILAARLRALPIVCVVNNIAVPYRAPRRWFDWPLDRMIVGGVSRWIVATAAAKQALISVLRVDPAKVSIIANGIPPRQRDETRAQTRARLGIPEDALVFSNVAVFERRKGHLELIKAIASLAKQRRPEQMPLVIIEGDGQERRELGFAANEHRVSAFITFIGREENIYNLLLASDGLVETSLAGSPMPNIVSEAMGLGLPVIGSVHSSTEQITDGKDGLLIDPADPDALAAVVSKFCDDATLRQHLGKAARDTFEKRFSASKAAELYSAVYSSLLP